MQRFQLICLSFCLLYLISQANSAPARKDKRRTFAQQYRDEDQDLDPFCTTTCRPTSCRPKAGRKTRPTIPPPEDIFDEEEPPPPPPPKVRARPVKVQAKKKPARPPPPPPARSKKDALDDAKTLGFDD